MDDLIGVFIAETREMLEAMGGAVVAWEAAPEDRSRLDEIFRFVHTVKGNCGFFDLPRIKALSHAAEDCLSELRSGARSADHRLVSAVLAVIDRIGELVDALDRGAEVAEGDDRALIEALSIHGPKAESGAAAAVSAPRAAPRTIRLPVELLDRMMNGVSDLVLARNELGRELREGAAGIDVEAAFERVSGSIADIREAITRTRMQRMDMLFSPLPRIVRDICAELGKQVSLNLEGGEVELDREMIEMIRDPLTHIVRNAIDHGIEEKAEREALGKPPAGRLDIRARQSGNQILIEVEDDGRGIDGDALALKALRSGLITAAEADALSLAQKCALIFKPGLSTAGAVTAISGRGVGMDVVRANIERIGGLVDLDSRRGAGLRLTLRVPLTLTIIPALTVSVAGQSFAIPRSAIEEIVRITGKAVRIDRVGGSDFATVRGKRVPLVCLGELLGTGRAAKEEGRSLVLLKPGGGDIYALAVDHFCDHEELVVKPAAPVVMATGLYAGTTLGDDGCPILLLDPAGMAACAGVMLGEAKLIVAEPAERPATGTPSLLFRTLGGGKRLAPLAAVLRIEEVRREAVRMSAGRLHVALGEQILPLAGCSEVPDVDKLRILRLSDGENEIGYAFAEVIDMVSMSGDVRPAAEAGEARGVTLIDGDQVELLDLYWLFERYAARISAAPGRPTCVLPTGDPWMDTILRPIIESAGYQIVESGDADAASAELHIVNADAPEAAAHVEGPSRVLKIRSSSDGRADGSIHRYDRAGLLAALRPSSQSSRKG